MKEALLLEAPFTEAMYAMLHEERLATIADSLQPSLKKLDRVEPHKRENVDDAWRDTRRSERPDLDLVRTRERERIERDLHDDLGGNLSALKILLELTWQQMPATTQLEQRRAQWNQLIDRSIESIHRIATNLRPSALEHGLLAAQRKLARINEIIVVVITVAALVGVLVGGESGRVIDATVIVVLCVVPWLRVVWLVARWRRIGDMRFVAVGVTLLTLTVVGVALTTLVK